jgi:hypothetical protein
MPEAVHAGSDDGRSTEDVRRGVPASATPEAGAEARRPRSRKHRAAERARQDVHRAGPQPAADGSGCHAPASAAISAELQDKVRRIVAEAARMSRAGLDRGVREILKQFGQTWANAGGCRAPASLHKPP